MDPLSLFSGLALALVPGVIVPVLVVGVLARSLTPAAAVPRPMDRRPTAAGIGAAWLVWALALLVTQTLLDVAYTLTARLPAEGGLLEQLLATPLTFPLYALPFTLVAGATALGMLEDGARRVPAVRGRDGGAHVSRSQRAVRFGGTAALGVFYGGAIASSVVERSVIAGSGLSENGAFMLAWVCSAAVITLAADLFVRLDIAPARTLKLYGLSVVVPAALVAISAVDAYTAEMAGFAGETGFALFGTSDRVALAIATVVVLLGPLVATWRAETSGHAALGSAGATTAGAVVGYLLSMTLSLAGLVVAAVVVGALDLAAAGGRAEAAFSRVAPLAWFDRIGRGAGAAASGPERGSGTSRTR